MKIFNVIDNADIIGHYYERCGEKMNVLIAYPYLTGQAYTVTKPFQNLIDALYLDSGAYSASRGKVRITVSEYAKYIARFGHLFDEVFSLDDDFNNPEHNFNNQIFLEKGLPEGAKKPIPVIHDPKDPFAEFAAYADQGYTYIAIGSNRKLPDEVFEKIHKEYPDVKVHMFGNLDRKMLLKHKPFSCDSASWAHQAGFGSIYYLDPTDGKVYQIYVGEKEQKKKADLHFSQFKKKDQLETFLRETFQFEYGDLLASTYNKWVVNLYFFKQLEDYVNSH